MKLSLILAALILCGAVAFAAAQASRPARAVVGIELPLKVPAVGNIEAVRQWRFGRLQDAEMTAGNDVRLRIMVADGSVLQLVGPGPALSELAFQSNWVRSPSRSFPGRSDTAERMIAFDYDENRRIIAMASLEPIARDPNRLRRALGF